MKTSDFFVNHPVFSLAEATEALSQDGGRSGTLNRLKYYLKAGRLKPVCRGIYAVVPPAASIDRFLPDPILVAAVVQPEGVFSHHSALELLGVAHSMWQQCTLYVTTRRRPLVLNGNAVRFMEHPACFRGRGRQLGVRKIERQGRLILVTGPERTLVEGFYRPSLTGGAEELVRSASGFTVLDLDLLEKVLKRHDIANLWAATGWFLERFQKTFHVPDAILTRMERRRPRSKQYLERGRRGGILAKRWNLILPKEAFDLEEPGELLVEIR
jgi:predicted transcriptional regulator of viral defense system